MNCRRVTCAAVTAIALGGCSASFDDTTGTPRDTHTAAGIATSRDVAADATADRDATAGSAPAAVLAALDLEELRALDAARLPAGRYWVDDPSAQPERIERIVAAEHAARAALLEHFGPAAVRAPVFRDLFMPLHDRMPELDSEQQIVIHDLERRYVAARLGAASGDGFTEHLARIRERLGAAIALRYAWHTSPLSAELRSAGFALSEEEFRDAYEILDIRDTDQGSFVAVRRMLRERLGTQRFVALWARRDPRFSALQAVAARFGLTETTLLSAYTLLLDNEDAMLAAVGSGDPDSAQAQRDLRTIWEDARRRLSELIGDEPADAMLRSLATASARVSEARRCAQGSMLA